MEDNYILRLTDKIIEKKLSESPAICIEGPKWCGKTTSARKYAKSELSVISEREVDNINRLIDCDYNLVLNGVTPKLIDEWQNIPPLWDYVRYESDRRNKAGQFILTGSSMKEPGNTLHSGAGRISRMKMRTLSLFESGESNGNVSLYGMFNGAFDGCISELSVDSLADSMIRGGWPFAISKGIIDSAISSSFIDNICKSKIVNIGDIRQSTKAVERMIKSISRNICMTTSFSKIYREMIGDGKTVMSEQTAKKILGRLMEGYVVENLPAWNEHVRSRNQLIVGEKWHFCDPSIALAALNIKKGKLFDDMEYFGFAFESLCLRDLRVYSSVIDGHLSHYRQKNGFEIDFILELEDGRWAGIEAKLGSREENKAADNLNRLKDASIEANHSPPSFLMILTAGKYAYRRKDGIYVVPIGCLRD